MKKEIDWGTILSNQKELDKYLESLGHKKLKWYVRMYNFFRDDVPFAISDFLFECKMKYQILSRGYSDRNVWGMCDDIAELNIKLLTALRENSHGYPDGLTEKKWKAILTKMIEGFETVNEDNWELNKTAQKKNEKKFQEGMELYTQWYKNLWD